MNVDEVVDKVIEDNPKVVEDVKAKPQAIGRLIGVAMKMQNGMNPKIVKQKLEERLNAKVPEREKKEKQEKVIEWYINNETGRRARISKQWECHPLTRATIYDGGKYFYIYRYEDTGDACIAHQNDFLAMFKREEDIQ